MPKKKKDEKEKVVIEVEATAVDATAKETVSDNTDLAPATATPEDVSNCFLSLDVKELNDAVQKIADRDQNISMSADEKTYAMSVIDAWDKSVVEQITDESNKLRNFVNSISGFKSYWRNFLVKSDMTEPFEKILAVAGLEDKAAALGALVSESDLAQDKYDEVCRDEPDIDVMTATEPQRIDAMARHQIEVMKAKSDRDAALRKLNRAIADFSRDLYSNDKVKAAITMLGSLDRKLASQKRKVQQLSQSAKLAVAIDSPEMRTMLSSLININLK